MSAAEQLAEALRERVTQAVFNQLHGDDNPHHNPEGWDFASTIADAALAALSEVTQ